MAFGKNTVGGLSRVPARSGIEAKEAVCGCRARAERIRDASEIYERCSWLMCLVLQVYIDKNIYT